MAPSTPPPPSRELFAALTMASTSSAVMSLWTTISRVNPVSGLRRHGELAQPVAPVAADQLLDQLGRVAVRPIAQRDPIAELLTEAVDRGGLVAGSQEHAEDGLDYRRVWR